MDLLTLLYIANFHNLQLACTITILSTLLAGKILSIPDICQFWDTTALFSPEKVHYKVRTFATK